MMFKKITMGCVAFASLLLFGCSTTGGFGDAGQDINTKVVTAKGVGATQDEAQKNALYRAVEQVVGTIVDAQIEIENDRIIKDKILTLSAGYVDNFKVIEQKQVGDNLEVTILGAVKRTQLLSDIADKNVPVRSEVKGEALWAQAVTHGRLKEDADKILAELLSTDPRDFIVEQTSKPALVPVGELDVWHLQVSDTWLRLNLKISVDKERLEKNYIPKLSGCLKGIATDQHNVRLRSFKRTSHPGYWRLGGEFFLSPQHSPSPSISNVEMEGVEIDDPWNQKDVFGQPRLSKNVDVLILDNSWRREVFSETGRSFVSKGIGYTIPLYYRSSLDAVAQELWPYGNHSGQMRYMLFDLVDQTGAVVASTSVGVRFSTLRWGNDEMLFIYPHLLVDDSNYGVFAYDKVTLTLDIPLGEEVLKRVRKVNVSLVESMPTRENSDKKAASKKKKSFQSFVQEIMGRE